MVYTSKGKTRNMALNGLERSFLNDSLDGGDWNRTVVAPESTLNGDTDFSAFSHGNQDDLYLRLFPNWMVSMMQDKSNWKNRVSGISRIQSVIDSVPEKSMPHSDLAAMLEFVSAPMNDSHFKVNQMGLELLESLVKKVGKRVKPHIPNLVSSILIKMGSNKYLIKQAGMRLLMELMRINGPELVVREIVNSGLHYKTSRVREESINTITAALLSFPNTEFRLLPLMRDLATCMVDTKPKVRQASFEAMALLCTCMERTDMKELVSTVAAINKNGKNAMDAFHVRISRAVLPKLNADGLVEHAIPAANAKVPNQYTGADVEWILSAGTSKVQPNGTDAASKGQYSNQRKLSNGGTSMFRPYRSAGKRLPWEIDQEELANNHTVGPLKPHDHIPLPVNPVHSLSPKHHPPTTTTTTVAAAVGVKRTSGSYAKMHLDRISRTPSTAVGPLPGGISSTTPVATTTMASVNGSLSTTHSHHVSSLGDPSNGLRKYGYGAPLSSTMPPRMNPGVSQQRPPLPMPSSAQRHNSLPDAFNNSTSGYVPTTSVVESNGPTSMSVTWPRSQAVQLGGGPTVPVGVPPQRMSQQISADAVGVVGGVHSSVKTSVSRPLSKPRVRNPLTLLKKEKQSQKHSPNSSSGALIPNLGSSPKQTESPTQLERDFLASNNADTSIPSGWGENSWDEEYYKTIPEDTAILNSSLSSSLSSLCNGREVESARNPGEFDKLKHIRKEAASRKAQLLSAATSASNSPEFSRHSSGETKTKRGGENSSLQQAQQVLRTKSKLSSDRVSPEPSVASSNSKPVVRKPKWDSTDGAAAVVSSQSVDLNHTYTVGVKEDKPPTTYSMAFAAKKQSTPTRTSRLSNQAKRERQVPVEEATSSIMNEISLEGVSLDREGKESQPKRKSRKVDPPRGNLPPPRLRSNSLSHDGSVERRPSIEKGGTNTIDMEISGVGSQCKASATDTTTTSTTSTVVPNTSTSATLGQLSQTTKESLMRKRQKQQQDEEPGDGYKVQSASYSTTKKPPIPPAQDTVTTSAPVENVRKRNKRKSRVSSNSQNGHQTDSSPDETPKCARSGRRNSITISDMDSSFNGGGSSDELVELHPFNNPEQGLKDALRNVGSDDWSSKCAGLLGVRRVAMYNPEVLHPSLHTVVVAVEKEVKNLRSTVARAAIACVGDLFAATKRSMEQYLDSVVRILLHKSCESNAFIREDVDKVFHEMIRSVSFGKCLTALVNGGLSHRSSQVRKTTSKFIFAAVECYGPSKLLHSPKDVLDKGLPAIIKLVGDSSQEVRYNARRCLNLLWPQPEFEKVASRVLSEQQLTKAKDTIEHLKAKGVGDSPESQSAKHNSGSRHSTGGPTRTATHSKAANTSSLNSSGSATQNGYQESTTTSGYSSSSSKSKKCDGISGATDTPLPDGILERLKASSWSERLEAVSELEDFVTTYPYSLGPHLHKVFDVFCPRLTDRNSKVNLHALEAFSNMVPMLCNILVPVVSNVVGALVPNLASRNATIHSMAMTVLDLLSQCIDPVYLIQPVANNGQYGNARVQPIMIKKLAELTNDVYGQKPQLVSRQVLPVMWHLVSAKVPATGETKVATLVLCDILWQCMGQSFLDSASHLPPEHRKKFDSLISSLEKRW